MKKRLDVKKFLTSKRFFLSPKNVVSTYFILLLKVQIIQNDWNIKTYRERMGGSNHILVK